MRKATSTKFMTAQASGWGVIVQGVASGDLTIYHLAIAGFIFIAWIICETWIDVTRLRTQVALADIGREVVEEEKNPDGSLKIRSITRPPEPEEKD